MSVKSVINAMPLRHLFGANEVQSVSLLESLEEIKQLFNNIGMKDIPFFIAGGSVYSHLVGNTPNNSNDIDVYFYNNQDAELATTALNKHLSEWHPEYTPIKSKNACTYPSILDKSNKPLQIITRDVGEPLEVFETFDFYQSMCALTSEGVIVKHPKWSTVLKIKPEMISADSLRRAEKYINIKGVTDPDQKTQKLICDCYVDNFYGEFFGGYGDKVRLGHECLAQIKSLLEYKLSAIVGRMPIEQHIDALYLFIKNTWYTHPSQKFHAINMCDESFVTPEFVTAYYMYDSTHVFGSSVTQESQKKYPEYYI